MDEEQQEQYLKAQLAAVLALRRIGVKYILKDRIEPMKVMRYIANLWKTAGIAEMRENLIKAENAVAELVRLRCEGLEIPSAEGKYRF